MPPVGFGTPATHDDKRVVSRLSFGHASLEPLAALSEGAVVLVAGLFSTLFYHRVIAPSEKAASFDFLGVAVMAMLIFVTLSYLTGGYEPNTYANRRASIITALKTWGLTLGFMALCAFMLKVGAEFSRATVLLYAASGAGSIALVRTFWPDIVRHAVEHNLVFVTNVMVVRINGKSGQPNLLDSRCADELRRNGFQPVGWHSVSIGSGETDLSAMIDAVDDQVRLGRLKEIVILADHDALPHLETVVEHLRVIPLPVRFILDPVTKDIIEHSLKKVGSLVLAEYQRAPFSITERAFKRALDITCSLVGMILLSPIFVLTALAVKLDSPGAVLFRQSRRGFGGKTFMILKFRSMTVADNGAVVLQAKRNDARITRVGKWLRRTSLDELPQLWNVFAGEMSIVGPRPHAVAHDDYYSRLIEQYAFRHHAKPGLTGWAQVKGLRGETPLVENMKARIEKDIWYIDNWSIWLDISIIIRTVLVVAGQKTAY